MGFAWRKKDSSSFSSSSNSCSSSSSRLPLLPLRHRARGEGGGARHLPRGVQHLRQEVRCEVPRATQQQYSGQSRKPHSFLKGHMQLHSKGFRHHRRNQQFDKNKQITLTDATTWQRKSTNTKTRWCVFNQIYCHWPYTVYIIQKQIQLSKNKTLHWRGRVSRT